jgi:hypothetical protein
MELTFPVMPGLVPATRVFSWIEDVGGRDKPGHEEQRAVAIA